MSKILYEWVNSQGVVDKYNYVLDFLRASSTLSGADASPIIEYHTPAEAFIGSPNLTIFIKKWVLHKLLLGLVPLPPAQEAAAD